MREFVIRACRHAEWSRILNEDTGGTEVLKRELNSFFRRRRSSETSGKSPAEKGHGTRRLLLLLLLHLLSRRRISFPRFHREFSMEYSSCPFSPSSTASRSRSRIIRWLPGKSALNSIWIVLSARYCRRFHWIRLGEFIRDELSPLLYRTSTLRRIER